MNHESNAAVSIPKPMAPFAVEYNRLSVLQDELDSRLGVLLRAIDGLMRPPFNEKACESSGVKAVENEPSEMTMQMRARANTTMVTIDRINDAIARLDV